MDESAKTESHSSSAVAFVEGGIQDGCDDACSICLDAFCDSNPSTVTSCKHEFHLQCILEWCQRSSQCPMCWQAISMKDPISQELLEAVEQERSFRLNNARTTNIYRRPDFELQHVAVGGSDDEIEERFFQHLAAASIRRAHQNSQREGRGRSGSHGHPQYLVLSPNSYGPPESSIRASSAPRAENEPAPAIMAADPSAPITTPGGDFVGGTPLNVLLTSGTNSDPSTASNSSTRAPAERSSPVSQDRPGPSDLQSLSSLKSRLSSVSMRYRDSISKSTRGWRERMFSRSNSVADIGSEVRREINAGIASVSRMMERFDTRESRSSATSASPSSPSRSARGPGNGEVIVNHVNARSNNSTSNDGVSVNQTNTEPSHNATSSWAVPSGPN